MEPRRIDTITPGFYETRLVKGGPPVPARIAFLPPDDPVTGEPLDRSYRFRMWICGREVIDDGRPTVRDPETGRTRRGFLDRLWGLALNGTPIDEHRYQYLLDAHSWEVEHRPDLPGANPHERVDLGRVKSLF